MKYLLFDFDGVIVDTINLSYSINNKTDKRQTIEEYRHRFDNNFYSSLPDQKNNIMEIESVRNFFVEYKKGLNRNVLIEGMDAVIETLAKDYKMFIISSTVSNLIEDFLNEQKLRHYFVEVLGAETERSKTKKIKNVFDKYKTDANNCLFITDTLGDIREAREVNVDSIAVTWGCHSLATLETGNPLFIADKPLELPKLINNYFKN